MAGDNSGCTALGIFSPAALSGDSRCISPGPRSLPWMKSYLLPQLTQKASSGKCGLILEKALLWGDRESKIKDKSSSKAEPQHLIEISGFTHSLLNLSPTSKFSHGRMNCSINKCKRKWLIYPSHPNWLARLPYLQDIRNEWDSCDYSQAHREDPGVGIHGTASKAVRTTQSICAHQRQQQFLSMVNGGPCSLWPCRHQ